jgi:uncharacterized protein (TIGR03083 family)
MDVATLYRETRERLLDTAAGLGAEQVGSPVPALPGWTVRDAYGHLTGLCADMLDGRMEGAGSPAWTAVQVSERAARPFADVRAEWAERGRALDDVLRAAGSEAPPFVAFDVWTHEQDIRGALGEPGEHDDDRIHWLAGSALAAFAGRYEASGAPAVRIVHTTGERVLGAGAATTTLRVDDYELVRILFGRRSAHQVASADWSGEPTAVVEHLHLFDLPLVDLAD